MDTPSLDKQTVDTLMQHMLCPVRARHPDKFVVERYITKEKIDDMQLIADFVHLCSARAIETLEKKAAMSIYEGLMPDAFKRPEFVKLEKDMVTIARYATSDSCTSLQQHTAKTLVNIMPLLAVTCMRLYRIKYTLEIHNKRYGNQQDALLQHSNIVKLNEATIQGLELSIKHLTRVCGDLTLREETILPDGTSEIRVLVELQYVGYLLGDRFKERVNAYVSHTNDIIKGIHATRPKMPIPLLKEVIRKFYTAMLNDKATDPIPLFEVKGNPEWHKTAKEVQEEKEAEAKKKQTDTYTPSYFDTMD
jgi:hypothetical protein